MLFESLVVEQNARANYVSLPYVVEVNMVFIRQFVFLFVELNLFVIAGALHFCP